MGRRSYAYQIALKLSDNDCMEEGEEGYDRCMYIVVYDFSTSSKSIAPGFYRNLKRLQEFFNDGIPVQKSVIECMRKNTAIAIAELAKIYGAKVRVYKINDLIDLR